MNRLARAAWWLVPPVFCLAVHWQGLTAWFHQDDFAWLGLRVEMPEWGGLLPVLFAPMAQGTIRPLSERLFFMIFEAVFGVEPLPFHIWVFLTQFASLALLAWIVRRLTGSAAAGFLAPVLWVSSSALARPLAWSSAYNQILCGFFVLSSFASLLRYIDTGERRWRIAQWAAFLLGFGALEINVMLPALAAVYTFLFARRHLPGALLMFAPSAAFVAVHRLVAPAAASGPYATHFDFSIVPTFLRYLHIALGPEHAGVVQEGTGWPPAVVSGVWLLGSALAAFCAWKLLRRDWLAAFFPAWFVLLLAPVLPLRDHVSAYYLTLPLAGLAALGAWAAACAWKAGWLWRGAAGVCLLVWFTTSVPAARAVARVHHVRGRAVKNMVLGVVRARQLHPREIILLAGVDSTLFWSGIIDKPFRLFGVRDVYLVPDTEKRIQAQPELGRVEDFVLPQREAWRALTQYRAVVYDAGGPRLRNVTDSYISILGSVRDAHRFARVDAGDPFFERILGPGWHGTQNGTRWMGKRASLTMAAPRLEGEKLYLSGWAPSAGTPVRVTVSGKALAPATVLKPGQAFDLKFELPPTLLGTESMEVSLEVERTFRAHADSRDLGLRFGVFELR